MPRPTSKDKIEMDQNHLKDWEEYQHDRIHHNPIPTNQPILLPVSIDMKKGIIVRNRIKVNELVPLWERATSNMPGFMKKEAQVVFDHYRAYFDPIDNAQGLSDGSPLDFNVQCPVLFLMHFPRENWCFTGHTQISVENDDIGKPSITCLSTFDNMSGLIFIDRNLEGNSLKYNLHVTIAQPGCKDETLTTDIIIDPVVKNDGWP